MRRSCWRLLVIGQNMDIEDITDADLEFVNAVRKHIRTTRKVGWFYLGLTVAQIAILIALVWLVTMIYDDVDSEYHRQITSGLLCGFIFGSVLAVMGWGVGKCLRRFLDGVFGSKQDRLLVKYFEIATGQKQARDLVTARTS